MLKNLPACKSSLATAVDDELLVYLPGDETAHCLGSIGKLVFEACQAGRSPDELISQLAASGVDEAELAMHGALEELAEKGLIENLEQPPASFDRRKFLAWSSKAAASIVVMSALAPRPAEAATCDTCQIDALNNPLNCARCGNPCILNIGDPCGGVAICCFEYILNVTANGGASGTCFGNEGSGIYRCRGGAFTTARFRYNCADARDNLITNLGGVDFDLYYCCSCAGAPSQFTC